MPPWNSGQVVGLKERDRASEELLSRLLAGPLIIDPTLTLEGDRLGLQGAGSELTLPSNWVRLVESRNWQAVRDTVRALRWNPFFGGIPEIGRDRQAVVKDWIGSVHSTYASTPADRERLQAISPSTWNFTRPTDAILADVYSFLRGAGRSFIAKSRRPFFELRDRGTAILEFGGTWLQRKRRFFRGHPSLKFYVGTLIPLQLLLDQPDTLSRLIGVVAQEALAFTDP